MELLDAAVRGVCAMRMTRTNHKLEFALTR